MLRSPLQVVRNVAFAVAKLAVLMLVPLLIARSVLNEKSLLSVWVIGQVASVLVLLVTVKQRPPLRRLRPQVLMLAPLASQASPIMP